MVKDSPEMKKEADSQIKMDLCYEKKIVSEVI